MRLPAHPLDISEPTYYHIRMGTHVCGRAEPRSRNHRNQPTAKGAHKSAPLPRGLSHNCPRTAPVLFHVCSTSAPLLFHEIEPSATRWDKMEQFGTVFGKNRRPRPLRCDCPALGTFGGFTQPLCQRERTPLDLALQRTNPCDSINHANFHNIFKHGRYSGISISQKRDEYTSEVSE